jgi:hypothetical protein
MGRRPKVQRSAIDRGFEHAVDRTRQRGGGESILVMMQRLSRILMLIIAVVAALAVFGVNVKTTLAGLGIGGLAIALAAQKSLENIIGGVSVANCCSAPNSLGFPVLLRFCDAQSGRSFRPLHRYPGPLARTRLGSSTALPSVGSLAMTTMKRVRREIGAPPGLVSLAAPQRAQLLIAKLDSGLRVLTCPKNTGFTR